LFYNIKSSHKGEQNFLISGEKEG